MSNPFLTIAIPFYNESKYIEQSIVSVVNQSYTNWELLLINDGNDEACITIANSFVSLDSRIRLISDGQNKGLAARLNESVHLAKGKYYARMDADDIMCVKRIETQVRYLESHPDIDVLGSSVMRIDGMNNIVGSIKSSYNVSFIHPSIMGKTSWFRDNPYSEWCVRCQDKELWLRTSSFSKFHNLDAPLMFYRDFGFSAKKYIKSERFQLKIFRNYKAYNKSFVWCLQNSLYSMVKICLYWIFDSIGKTDLLIKRRRVTPVEDNLYLTKTNLLEAIKA